MDGTPNLNEIKTKIFIARCKEKFGWKDLSNDVIMDVGCGEEGFCAKEILDKFPNVRAIIAFDSNPNVLRIFKARTETKVQCVVADIEIKESLQYYENRMNKVLSTNVFHQVEEKEEAFRNMYRLLKPGGEAAVLFFFRSILHERLIELLKNPKWKDAYQREHVEKMYKVGFGLEQYKEMVEKIGFQVIECSEGKRVFRNPSDKIFKDALYQICGQNVKFGPELLEELKKELKEDCFQFHELSLLLVKPKDGASSKTKGNPDS